MIAGVALSLLPTWLLDERNAHVALANEYASLTNDATYINDHANENAAKFDDNAIENGYAVSSLVHFDTHVWNNAISQAALLQDISSQESYEIELNALRSSHKNSTIHIRKEILEYIPSLTYYKIDSLNDTLSHYVIFSEAHPRDQYYIRAMRDFNRSLRDTYVFLDKQSDFLRIVFPALEKRQTSVASQWNMLIIGLWIVALLFVIVLVVWGITGVRAAS